MFDINSMNGNIIGPVNNNNNNIGAPMYGPVGGPLSQPYYSSPYYPVIPWSNPTYSPTYSPSYRYRLPPYRLPPYYPPTYNYPIQTVPQIQTIPYPQYFSVPYLTNPYYYEEEEWDDPGHSCNTVVSHHCHHPGGMRGRGRRALVYDPWEPGYGGLSLSPWDRPSP